MANYRDPNDATYSSDPNYIWLKGHGWVYRGKETAATDAGRDPATVNAQPTPGNDSLPPETPAEQLNSAIGKIGASLGLVPNRITENAPGALLNTSDADIDRARLAPLLAQLRGQQSDGNGAWRQSLNAATQRNEATAQALGQSQAGVGAMTALQNIGNARAAASQREAGQAEILSNQAKNEATNRIDATLSGLGAQDIGQAQTAAQVAQGRLEANNAMAENARTNALNTAGKLGQGAATIATASNGGEVPGTPRVFGDDEKNDTVPAMLSPGELVIPRSHASSPEAAADFVRALRSHRGLQHLAGGGRASSSWENSDDPNFGIETGSPGGPANQAPSIENGGKLDTTIYDRNRSNLLNNAQQYAAQGSGPEQVQSQYVQNAQAIGNQEMQNATDSNVAEAMAMRRAVPAVAALQGAVTGGAEAAKRVGEGALGAQNQAQAAFANALMRQRALDQQAALAKQQAAWRNTQMNAGITLQNQNLLRNLLGGAGQGFASLASAGQKTSSAGGDSPGYAQSQIDDAFNSSPSAAGDFDASSGDGVTYAAHGGIVGEDEEKKAHEFLAAIRRRGTA